uniref:Glycerol-3-phosphate acyltransferase 4 n=1 Tax=Magallana gigas TaxID=29159 RepID=K1RKS4_MAGGI
MLAITNIVTLPSSNHKDLEFGKSKIERYEKQRYQREPKDSESHDDSDRSDKETTKNGGDPLIQRDIAIDAYQGIRIPSNRADYDLTNLKKEFHMSDIMYFAKCGVESYAHGISSLELRMATSMLVLWCLGCLLRYLLLPFRLRRQLNRYASLICHRILCRACSAVVTYHGRENMVKNGICVANHTSPLDVIILSCDNCYSLVGQRHGGFLGLVMKLLARTADHIYFERSEVKDRFIVAKRLKEHVEDKNKLPILIFPEEYFKPIFICGDFILRLTIDKLVPDD